MTSLAVSGIFSIVNSVKRLNPLKRMFSDSHTDTSKTVIVSLPKMSNHLDGEFASAGDAFVGDAGQLQRAVFSLCGSSATRFQRCSRLSTAPPTLRSQALGRGMISRLLSKSKSTDQ